MCFQKERTLELWLVEDQSLVFITLLSKSLTPRKPFSLMIEENVEGYKTISRIVGQKR
jgi:hypothetical protein